MSALRFDIDALMARLGEKRARRAHAYLSEDRVNLIAVEDGRLIALVTGETGKLYPVEARDDGEGECTCPDFPLERTCKHIGAVALAGEGLTLRDTRRLDGRLSNLRAALELEGREDLIQRVMDLARFTPGVIDVLEPEDGTA
jgi:uncharacterized Zn finger protein